MNILTNICNPKEQHFQQEARTEAYKPINDYVFQSRSMERMRVRNQAIQNPEDYRYQSWNHPYSISNYFMQKGTINGQNKQSLGLKTEHISHLEVEKRPEESHVNKKISFKEIPQAICGIGKEDEQGEKLFTKREDFYASLRADQNHNGKGGFSYQGRNYSHQQNNFPQDQNTKFSRIENLQNNQQSSYQHHSHILLTQQILRLKQQNKQLKRVVQQEYKPMKELYNKLLSQQQEREYLISKLEWKVKELVKEMGSASSSFGITANITSDNHANHNVKKENKRMSRIDSQQNLKPQTNQPFKTLENNFTNIKIPQNKINTFTNNYQNSHVGNNKNGEVKQFGQTHISVPTGSQNYQISSTLQAGIPTPTYRALYSSPQNFNTYSHPENGLIQQNQYISNLSSYGTVNTNFQTQSDRFRQNFHQQSQNHPITPTFNSNQAVQAHYNPTHTKFNY